MCLQELFKLVQSRISFLVFICTSYSLQLSLNSRQVFSAVKGSDHNVKMIVKYFIYLIFEMIFFLPMKN